MTRCLIAAILGPIFLLGGCRSGEIKSTTLQSLEQVDASALNVAADGDLTHEEFVARLRAQGGTMKLPDIEGPAGANLEKSAANGGEGGSAANGTEEPGETVASLKAQLRAAQVELEMAALRAELRAARMKIEELKQAASDPE